MGKREGRRQQSSGMSWRRGLRLALGLFVLAVCLWNVLCCLVARGLWLPMHWFCQRPGALLFLFPAARGTPRGAPVIWPDSDAWWAVLGINVLVILLALSVAAFRAWRRRRLRPDPSEPLPPDA